MIARGIQNVGSTRTAKWGPQIAVCTSGVAYNMFDGNWTALNMLWWAESSA